jgi:pimeloyl-ACP methyl ester carboxylesterase
MGGMTAAVVASQVATGIRGLILADPTFLSPERQREVYESDVVEQHRQLLTLDREEVLAQARVRHPQRQSDIVIRVSDARMKTRPCTFEVLTPPNPEYRRLVSSIVVPILLVIGDKGVVSLETAQELQSINPRLRIEQLQDTGHGLPYDQPELFAVAVKAFLRTLAAA